VTGIKEVKNILRHMVCNKNNDDDDNNNNNNKSTTIETRAVGERRPLPR